MSIVFDHSTSPASSRPVAGAYNRATEEMARRQVALGAYRCRIEPGARPHASPSPHRQRSCQRGAGLARLGEGRVAARFLPRAVSLQQVPQCAAQLGHLAVGEVAAEGLVKGGPKGLLGVAEHLPPVVGELDADDPAVLARRLAHYQAVLFEPVGDSRRPTRAAHQLSRDLAHLERVAGRELQPHEELELRPREVGFGAEALVNTRLDDAERLLQVDPCTNLILARHLRLQFHLAHANWNSLPSNFVPSTVATTTVARRRFAMSMTATDFMAPASEAELDQLAANLRARNFDVVVVQTGAEAKSEGLRRIPDGARIHSGKA